MPDTGKKPCCICRRWFRPDPRIGSRQRTCKNTDCQTAHRRKKQKAWRKTHPDYFIRKRIEKRGNQKPAPDPLRLPAQFSSIEALTVKHIVSNMLNTNTSCKGGIDKKVID